MATSLENSTKSSKVEIVETIKIPLINQEFLFVHGVESLKKLRKHFNKDKHELTNEVFYDFDEVNPTCDAYVIYFEEDNGAYYLAFVLKNIKDDVLETIVHEVVHLMQHIRLKFFRNKTEVEFEAYMTGWIFTAVCNLLKEKQLIK